MHRFFVTAFLIGGAAALAQTTPPAQPPAAQGQAPGAPGGGRAPRPAAPTRDPHPPGPVAAKERVDGEVPPPNVDGNFIIGPTHPAAPEMTVKDDVPHGTVIEF